VRAALSGLTFRGRIFLAVGLLLCVTTVLVGQPDVLRIGVLLAALPLASAWAVARTRYRLASNRRIDSWRVGVGSAATVTVRLDNLSRLPTGLLLVEDHVPYVLGTRPRFVLDRVEARGRREVSYTLRSEVRGRYGLGPLSLRLADPFGMCELQRSFTARDTLVITPRVHRLPEVRLAGEWSGSGESRSRSMAAAGEDDAATREYRHGDDLRRVHWRSTARQGSLMVRREEQPWQSRCSVLLDSRRAVHRGEGPASSFEWAVSAAASIAIDLVHRGYQLRLLTDTGASISSAAHDNDGISTDFEGTLLDMLAVLNASGGTSLRDADAALRRGGGDSLLVAVLGSITPDEAVQLARLRRGSTVAVAVLLETATWTTLPASLRARAADEYAGSARLLRAAGWRVLRASSATSLPEAWPGVSREGQAAEDVHQDATAYARHTATGTRPGGVAGDPLAGGWPADLPQTTSREEVPR
jgi:uncharacterized protein (DUF58 family)